MPMDPLERRKLAEEAREASKKAAERRRDDEAARKAAFRDTVSFAQSKKRFSGETDGKVPAIVLNCPKDLWVNHPRTGKLVRYSRMSKTDRKRYDDKSGRSWTRANGLQIIRDIDPFVSPIDNTIVGTRSDIRDQEERHNVIQVGDVDWDKEQTAAAEMTDQEYEEQAAIAYEKWEADYYRNHPDKAGDETGGLACRSDRGLRTGS